MLSERFEVSIVHFVRGLAYLIRAKTYRNSVVAITAFTFTLIIDFHDSVVVVVLDFIFVDQQLIVSKIIVLG